ncbi:MAG TPA: 30S ribosomal protein S9 [Polyangiaceae bacterium LLY-WYZ-15_(1-7)]|nr:30S ribosomal protein S9 [Myxococcales bacterium]MAT25748.1 30S ribosomal protein S9 [Sandaracinus sp.]HJK90890.1 30S ribosomal protein S9 [Polyangiaceae bacterium LLY-WYZ-15_(1-7)]HJK99821.1 30S ribosomal protein S9 [Polyangiaceae bacterium LLY-WYZ-15_(1-7)]HJL09482.1 30S ribosomal protein S9 [Polyangiaceae bacterium LLY-WYZ-15_(1-7)]
MAKPKQIHGRFYGTGKRKTAVARVFLSEGTGTIEVNGRTFEDYFPREVLRMIIEQPFDAIEKHGKFDVKVNVDGGGPSSQAEAVRHGISRALVAMDVDLKPSLKKAGLLTRDARKKERKKPGQPGARKKFQYSKR